MDFVSTAASKGVVEAEFHHEVGGRRVPGLLWRPEGSSGRRPVVLIGHGGEDSKGRGVHVAIAKRLVRDWGCAAVAIDGPAHGDRETDESRQLRLTDASAWRALYFGDKIVDEMIEDWVGVLEAAQALTEVGERGVAYWGLSMGTQYGLPLVAAEPRIRAAVLGLNGTGAPRLADEARRVRCPVLFMQQLDDELIPLDEGCALFGALGSAEKRLHVNPGKHAEIPPDEFRWTTQFLGERLRT